MSERVDLYSLGATLSGRDVKTGWVVPEGEQIGGFWYDEAVPGDRERQKRLAESIYKPRGYWSFGEYYPVVRMQKTDSIGDQFDALEKRINRKFALLKGRLRYHAKKMGNR